MTWSFSQQPPDSTGKKILTALTTISPFDIHVQQVQQYALPTYYVQSNHAAIQITANQCALVNVAASGYSMILLGLYLNNAVATGHAGVVTKATMWSTTNVPTGTALALIRKDSRDPSITTAQAYYIDTGTSLNQSTPNEQWTVITDDLRAAAAVGMAGMWGRNLLDRGPRSQAYTLAPGSAMCLSYSVADATSSIRHHWEVAMVPL